MIKFKKPKNFRSLDFPKKKNTAGIRWLFIFLFLFLLVGVWAFFRYGIDYLARFSSFFNDSEGEEMMTGAARDTFPPAPPIIDPLPEATNSAVLEVSGEAEVSSELNLFLNGEVIKKMVIGESGSFMVVDISLSEGDNSIFAVAEDMVGNKSQESVRQTIILDKEPPMLEIEFPEDGQSVSGDKREIIIKGKTEDNAVVTVNERKVVVDLDGNFEIPYALSDGANSIIIIAKDKAGNQTKEELIVNYRP
ncbi:MAG: hypothetical protein PHX72_01055 [Candidatus Shapirobacteria bacterium]|nr:hypothetical protein [Candidatus Shapirobacteria bacterium]